MHNYIIKQRGADSYLKSHEKEKVTSNDLLKTEKELLRFKFTQTNERKLAKKFDDFNMAESIRRECNACCMLSGNAVNNIKWDIEII